MPLVNDISESEAQKVISASTVPVLLDVWAPWCGPCKVLGPALEKIAPKYEGRIRFIKVNIDRNPQFKHTYAGSGVPRMILFSNGKQIDHLLGAHSIPTIEAMLNKHAPAVPVEITEEITQPLSNDDWLVKPRRS